MFNHISDQADKLVSLTKRLHSSSKTKVLAITSGKGGVGKSTITANISYLLSQKGKRVAVLDADIGLANLQILFDLKSEKTFYDYMDGTAELKDVLTQTKYKNISLVAGKSGYQYSSISSKIVFNRIVDEIISLNKYDFLLVDTGAGINEYVQEFLELTDNILAITTTDPSALTDVYALLKMVSIKKNKLMLCFNNTSKYETGEVITKSIVKLAIKNKLNRKFMVEYIGNIPESKCISTTGRLRKLFTKEFGQDVVSKQLSLIVDKLIIEIR
ncbi:MAG: P-loop NTPase [Campylobacterota bacterium]|nr:P-loop NTPase [Campylobacterota bacterium]